MGPLLGGFLVDSYGFRTAMALGGCAVLGCVGALSPAWDAQPGGPARRGRASTGPIRRACEAS